MNKFDSAIEFFDKSLKIEHTDDENKIKALMSKGSCYYKAKQLVSMGYERTDVVDRHGEFSRRGGIVDVYASNEEHPLRIELFGDEIESVRHFDSATQRSIDKIPSALILPAREVLLDPDTEQLTVASPLVGTPAFACTRKTCLAMSGSTRCRMS